MDNATKDTRVQISSRSRNLKVKVCNASQTVGQAGFFRTEPVAGKNFISNVSYSPSFPFLIIKVHSLVTDAASVNSRKEVILVLPDKIVETNAS